MTVLAIICDTANYPALMFLLMPRYFLGLQILWAMADWPYCMGLGQFRLALVIEYLSSANWLGHRLDAVVCGPAPSLS